MKFICEECEKPCILEVGDCYNLTADVLQCVCKNSCYCKWKEVKEEPTTTSSQSVTNCNRLPKLTAEVFNRPDCPEWAKWAIVSPGGYIAFFKEKPEIYENGIVLKGDYVYIWEKKYSTENWQNSIVERPTKLPDWCKVGQYGYDYDSGYFKIVEIIDGGINLKVEWVKERGQGTVLGCNINCKKQARLRRYNADEIPDLPFEVTERNSNFRTTVVSCQGNKVWLAGASTAISTEELMRDFTAKGELCGVLEHLEEGEWVR